MITMIRGMDGTFLFGIGEHRKMESDKECWDGERGDTSATNVAQKENEAP